jgi:hypothetical protein
LPQAPERIRICIVARETANGPKTLLQALPVQFPAAAAAAAAASGAAAKAAAAAAVAAAADKASAPMAAAAAAMAAPAAAAAAAKAAAAIRQLQPSKSSRPRTPRQLFGRTSSPPQHTRLRAPLRHFINC